MARFEKPKSSVRGKFIAVVLTTLSLVGISTTALVSWVQIQNTEILLSDSEQQIRDTLAAKGKILASNHALALRNSVLDNAFSDVNQLIDGAVHDDDDVIYGLFLGSDNTPWAYSSPSASANTGEKTAWKELKLGDAPPHPRALSVRAVRLFDDEIQEFSMPVIDEGEILGTIYYGISTSRMMSTLEAARTKSNGLLRETLLKIFFLVLANVVVGLGLSFRSARRITSPLNNLTQAAARIASGETDARADVKSGDEIELLGHAFNQMVSELAQSYRQLEALNGSLEDKVKARTAELATRNKDMRLVLDNAQQGFITLYPDGTMASERSAVVDHFLGTPHAGETLAAFIGRNDSYFGEMFDLSFEMINEEILPRELSIAQLPSRANVNGRALAFHYVDTSNGGPFQGLLVVIEDITDRLEHDRQQKEQSELMIVFKRIMQDRSGFEAFLGETGRQIQSLLDGSLDADDVVFKRTLHTIKGNCGVMGLHVVAEICHGLESNIAETHALPHATERVKLRDRWDVVMGSAEPLLGAKGRLEIEEAEHERLLLELARLGHRSLVERITAWKFEPVSRHFSRIEEQAVQLAELLGKGPLWVVKQSTDLRLDDRVWGPLWSDLVHAVRNCVDHGLYAETDVPPGHRQELRLSATVGPAEFILEVGDNGRGIDWDKIREKAAAVGLPRENHAHLVDALFTDGLSTRDEISSTSGRGVGMSALRSSCEALGGRIEVVSRLGQGTRFILRFPRKALYVEPSIAA